MKRKFPLLLVFLSFIASCLIVTPNVPAFLGKGRWVLDQRGQAVAPPIPGGRMMGLQTSGLSYDGTFLWSVGDQRSNFPGNVFHVDPNTARLVADPIRLEVTPGTQGEVPERLLTANPDLEGLCIKPGDPLTLYITVETDGLRILECRYQPSRKTVSILRVLSAVFVVDPIEGDRNARFEGVAADGETLYVAYEKDGGGHPHVYYGTLPMDTTELRLRELPVPFSRLPPRPEKGGVNVNGLDLLLGETRMLVMVARDQERLLFYELKTGQLSYVDLDFRDPAGREIYWTSPEAVAVDPLEDRLWVINDPDSRRGNYRLRDETVPSGNYKAMVPLLFEFRLSQILAARIPVRF